MKTLWREYILNLNKWKLVAVLLIIHFPLGLYLNFPVYSPKYQYTLAVFYYQLGTLIIVTGMLYVWLHLSELMLKILSKYLGPDFLFSFKIIPLFTTFAVAITMAISFVWAAGNLLTFAEWISQSLFQLPFRMLPVNQSEEFIALYQRGNIGFFLLLMLSSFYLMAYQQSSQKAKLMEIRMEQLAKEKIQAQLIALKDQLSPHFLFNSFTILSNLVYQDASMAERFIQELSKTYRYILENRTLDTVQLSTELTFLSSYIFLLQIRFKGKFFVNQEIPEDATRLKVPPVTLQLLFENVITHNQLSEEKPLSIILRAEDNYLIVSNTIRRKKQSVASTGLGLKNIQKRYAALTDRLVIINDDKSTFCVKIPLL
ncbi:sensor histidine kinase [Pseudochryseolinea flava]|uniref:Signal transduction histidine kinase internal region domain-containing protein n=1 Tax=Pseudochryseolinea flava TaxID=2059302 RepID=A0A364Y611_9BACT|nr:histidine kinase [Pseudochryseolinea flava]RAW01267.1 hypothetical protein DQQ10_10165 [Pseudochryseolinea flava]